VSDKIRVLVADDHFLVRRGIAALLSATEDLMLVAEARDGREAIVLYRSERPDVAILDVRMPGLDGPGAIRGIRAEFPDARLVALSNYEGDEEIHGALAAGAATYLLKRSVHEELTDTIRAVFRGEGKLPAEVKAKLAARGGQPVLTTRERHVLTQIAAGRSNKEIAAALGLSVNTINTHVAKLLGKLDAVDRTQAVATAVQRGLVRLD